MASLLGSSNCVFEHQQHHIQSLKHVKPIANKVGTCLELYTECLVYLGGIHTTALTAVLIALIQPTPSNG